MRCVRGGFRGVLQRCNTPLTFFANVTYGFWRIMIVLNKPYIMNAHLLRQPLVLLGLVLMLSACSQKQQAVPIEVLQLSNELIRENIVYQQEVLGRSISEIRSELYDIQRYRYRFLIGLLDSINNSFHNLNERIDTQIEMIANSKDKAEPLFGRAICNQANDVFEETITSYSSILNRYDEEIRLSSAEIKGLSDHYYELLQNFKSKHSVLANHSSNEKVIIERLLLLFMQQTLQLELNLLESFFNILGGRKTGLREFPVIVAENYCVRVGETFEAISYLATASYFDPRFVTLLVNNDTTSIDKNGVANLRIKADQKGIQNIELRYIITNMLTGYVFEITSAQSFTAH